MSLKNLGKKQTIVLYNCEIDNQKFDLVITPHTQTVGYIRTKRQTIKRKIISKQRQITRKRFSKQKNAFEVSASESEVSASEDKNASESEVSSLDALFKLNDSVNKNYPTHDQLYFSDSETTSNSSKKGKYRIKKKYKHKPVHLYNWNQPIRHIDNYVLTVIN